MTTPEAAATPLKKWDSSVENEVRVTRDVMASHSNVIAERLAGIHGALRSIEKCLWCGLVVGLLFVSVQVIRALPGRPPAPATSSSP